MKIMKIGWVYIIYKNLHLKTSESGKPNLLESTLIKIVQTIIPGVRGEV